MKKKLLILTLIVGYIFQSSAQDLTDITINERFIGKTLYNILDVFSRNYQLNFNFKEEDIPDKPIPGIHFAEMPLTTVLDELLEPYGVHYIVQSNGDVIIRKKGIEIIKTYDPIKFDFTLRGRLIDDTSGETLPFASVYVKSNQNGTSTNVDGHFTLLNVPTDTSTIVVQYIGYKVREVRLTPEMVKNDYVTLTLEPATRQLQEVVVSDQKEHMIKASGRISTYSVSPAQLAGLPSLGEKDIFRSLQLLPGVSGTNETSSGLFVRGGTPDQNLILFDGFTVYHVDHFYGFFSAFNANAVKDVQFHKGGFESKYGGRLSSVVVLTGKNGNTKEVSGNIGVSALSINGSLEVPFAKGNGSLFLSGRRSYTDIIRSGLYNDIFDLFQEESSTNSQPGAGGFRGGGGFAQTENEPAFHFYDLNFKLTYRPSQKDLVSFSFYNGQDKLDNSNDFNSNQFGGGGGFFGGGSQGGGSDFNNSTVDLDNWGNIGTSLRWGRQWNERLYANAIISYSKYATDRDRYSDTEVTRTDSTFNIRSGILEDNEVIDYTFRLDNEYLLNSDHTLSFGVQLTANEVDYNQIQNDTVTVLDRSDKGTVISGYFQDTWQPFDGFILIPGIRITQYSETNETYIEPRLSMSYQLTEKLKIKAAWGQYYQFVTRVVREDVTQGSRDFWLLSNNDLNPVSSSTHYIAGLSYETDGFLFDVEGYYKDLSGLSEYTLRFSNNFRAQSSEVDELFYEGSGYSQGVEFLLQKKFGKYTGWLGYTLSEVIHEFPELSDEPFPALHDQTHEFKIVNSIRLGSWTLSGTWVYATGKPYTSPIGFYELTLLDGATNSYISVGEKNAFRLPDYHRMDLSVIYGWDWGPAAKAELGFSVFNAYNNTNVWYKTFDFIDDDVVVTDVTTIGFTPNLFFNVKF